MITEPGGAAMGQVSRAESGARAHSVCERGAGEQRRHGGAAKHVPTSCGIVHLGERRWIYWRGGDAFGGGRIAGVVGRGGRGPRHGKCTWALAPWPRGR